MNGLIRNALGRLRGGKCCGESEQAVSVDLEKIAIVGNPNVGKSVLFNCLTRRYVTVSNYPGTTVEVSRGQARIGGGDYEIIDTPGMYSLVSLTEEERVARDILLDEAPGVVVHVVDGKNLGRMLPLTLQLLEAGLPVVLVLNMMDEARRAGVRIDAELLESELGIPVVPTVSTTGEGLEKLEAVLTETVATGTPTSPRRVIYSDAIEDCLGRMAALLPNTDALSGRALGMLWVCEDAGIQSRIAAASPGIVEELNRLSAALKSTCPHPIHYEVALRRNDEGNRIIGKVLSSEEGKVTFGERLSRLTMRPLTGIPILLLVLYFGLYKFVGDFGAGTVVDFLETKVFEGYLNPFFTRIVESIIPWHAARELFVGEYGVITLGVRYAIALILPIVTFFFLVFSIIEDTGYLPRLAMLIDRTFKRIGLSGRAVIPMVLGFGCDTMATMVTRTLPTRRERVISTMLLSLAVPCSAQLGVILALLQGRPGAMLVWVGVVVFIFLFVGFLAAKVLPGKGPSFYMEVPPLRLPKLSNVLVKTYVRVKWYFKEILPLFLAASVLIWLGQLTRLFDLCLRALRGPVSWIGLPPETSKVFLFGFFRRDYGAAGLYDLNKAGLLNGRQIAVSCVALTLFLPCIAQFLMNVKERGWKTGVAMSAFTLFMAFGVAFAVNSLLVATGVNL